MSEQPQFFSYTREEFLDEFVHPDDCPAVEEARQRRKPQVAARYLTDMRKKGGLTQAEVAWTGALPPMQANNIFGHDGDRLSVWLYDAAQAGFVDKKNIPQDLAR